MSEGVSAKELVSSGGSQALPVGPLGILSLDGCRGLAERVNSYLISWKNESTYRDGLLFTKPGYNKDSYIIETHCPRFTNGEGKAVISESVRGYDLYLFCDVGNYSRRYTMYDMEVPMSPDDHFQDLKRVISAVGGKAKRITVIMPLLYEGRQHGRNMRESLDCAVALQELERLGVSNIITFDAHDPKIQNAVPFTGFDNILPTYQMLKALLRDQRDLLIDPDHMMIISPDEGAINRNIYYSTVLGLDLGMFYKRRDYTSLINGRNPIVAHEYIGDSVDGKDIIIADDMMATGDSMMDVAYELKSRGARHVFAFTTFGLFTKGLDIFDKAYKEGIFTRILATNLSYLNPVLKQKEWFLEVDCSKYLAYLIATLNHDFSVNALLEPYERIKTLLKGYKAQSDITQLSLNG